MVKPEEKIVDYGGYQMILEDLGKGLKSVFNRLVTTTAVDKKTIEGVVTDIKKSLLQSDVNLQLANELANKIKKRSLEEKTPAGMTKREQVLKIDYDELIDFLGEKFEPLELKKKPSIILMAGLLGSGKTTTVAKLSRYLQKQGNKVCIICADVYRPAGLEQLQQLGQQVNVPVYGEKNEKNPINIIKNGLKEFSKKDVIIIDTAGRHKQEEKLMEELKQIGEIINPDETILVIDGTIGQIAKLQAEAFNKAVPIGSIIITKLDGTANGGGSLSACAATGAKVKFIGTGEKIDEFEPYDPTRFVSRMLGLGDMQTLLDKAKDAELKPEMAEKLLEGKFTLDDFYEQIESMGKMGSLEKIAGMIPGFGMMKLPQDALAKQEQQLKKYKIIIQSLTKDERANPSLIAGGRIKRVASGAGVAESDVRDMLKQYDQIKKLTRMLGRGNKDMMKLMKQFGGKMPF